MCARCRNRRAHSQDEQLWSRIAAVIGCLNWHRPRASGSNGETDHTRTVQLAIPKNDTFTRRHD